GSSWVYLTESQFSVVSCESSRKSKARNGLVFLTFRLFDFQLWTGVFDVPRTPCPVRLQLSRGRFAAGGAGRLVRGAEHAGDGAPRPRRRLRRPALSHGGAEGRHSRPHRRRSHLDRGLPVSPFGRDARGVSEPLPPDHAHETARQERPRRCNRGGAGRARFRVDLPNGRRGKPTVGRGSWFRVRG